MSESIAFDRAAGYYDATRGFAPEQESAIAAALAAALGPPSGPVLELGVGTGRIAIPLQQQGGYAYYGIDLARPMLEKLRENAAARGDHRFPLVQGDIMRLPFPDRTFAALIAVHVFHLVPDWRATLVEARRVLRPGGLLVYAGNRAAHEDEARDIVDRQWRALLEEAGYTLRARASHHLAPQINEALVAQGAHAVETSIATRWTTSRTLRQAYDGLASRRWSATWTIPDDLFAATLARLQVWLAQEHAADLDTPQDTTQEFYITRARF